MKTTQDLIRLLEDLWSKADMRSRTIIDNGREVTDAERAKSQGYADAYFFCIMMLKRLEDEKGT